MKTNRAVPDASDGPSGDASRHLALEDLQRGLEALDPPKDWGRLALIVVRGDDGRRNTPQRVVLTPDGGVPGDTWFRNSPDKKDSQITLMRADVARLFANGQPLALFGDNLLVELDLSVGNLPAGSRLRIGAAILEVTPEPHTGCAKFRQRVGNDALRLTADRRFANLRLRGIYLKVVHGGEIAVGDAIAVLSRGTAEPARMS